MLYRSYCIDCDCIVLYCIFLFASKFVVLHEISFFVRGRFSCLCISATVVGATTVEHHGMDALCMPILSETHVCSCKKAKCGRCVWLRNKASWQEEFQVFNECERPIGSWLVDNNDGVGCDVCSYFWNMTNGDKKRTPPKVRRYAKFKLGSPTNLKKQKLSKHSKSKHHQQCVKLWVKMKSGQAVDVDVDVIGTPDEGQWQTLLEHVHKHSAVGNDGLAKVGSGKKCRFMALCAGDALLRRHQKHMRKCKTTSLARDARKGRLMVRFVSTTPPPHFQTKTGLLGVERDPEPGAIGVLKGTKQIMKRFCRVGGRKKYCKKFFKHLQRTVKFVTVDAATDETLATELGRVKSTKVKALKKKMTPGLAHYDMDKTHGGRRLLSRPWAKDVRAKQVVGKLARGKKCPAALMHNSRQIRSQFKRVLKKSGKIKLSGHFHFAKHRMESWRSPLSKTVRSIRPMGRLMSWVAVNMDGKPKDAAKEWIREISSRDVLLGGMLSDAATEGMSVIRFADKGSKMDCSSLDVTLLQFLHIIKILFVDGTVLEEPTSFASIAMSRLAEPLPLMVSADEVVVLSQPSEEDVRYCLDVMKDYCQMAVHIVNSEFPLFEISQAFSILDLNHDHLHAIRHSNETCTWDTKCKTLCDLISDDVDEQFDTHVLKEEITALHPIARSMGGTVPERWAQAHQKVQGSKAWSTKFKLEASGNLIVDFKTFISSTSDVERIFTKVVRTFSSQQESCSAEYEEALCRIISDFVPTTKTADLAFVRECQKAWTRRALGEARSSGESRSGRVDKGVSKVIEVSEETKERVKS